MKLPKQGNDNDSEVAQSCPTLCDPMDSSQPSSSIHGIFQARILEWVAISFSRIFLTQGLNPGLPHCRQTLYRPSHDDVVVDLTTLTLRHSSVPPRNQLKSTKRRVACWTRECIQAPCITSQPRSRWTAATLGLRPLGLSVPTQHVAWLPLWTCLWV